MKKKRTLFENLFYRKGKNVVSHGSTYFGDKNPSLVQFKDMSIWKIIIEYIFFVSLVHNWSINWKPSNNLYLTPNPIKRLLRCYGKINRMPFKSLQGYILCNLNFLFPLPLRWLVFFTIASPTKKWVLPVEDRGIISIQFLGYFSSFFKLSLAIPIPLQEGGGDLQYTYMSLDFLFFLRY